jgi:cyclic dehypoxanthinyl futalosine synthase
VIHLSRLSQLAVPDVIARLIAAGLDSIPGGGAEILVDRVRKLLHCYGKATAGEWLDVMRHAHRAGLRTTATMMRDGGDRGRADRASRAPARGAGRDRRFTAFITWSYQPDHRARRVGSDRHRLPAHLRSRASSSTTSTTSRRRG